MSTKDSIPTGIKRTVAIMLATIFVFSTFTLTAFAAPAKTEVPGQVYEFGKDSHYEFSDSKDSASSENACQRVSSQISIRFETPMITQLLVRSA